MMVLLFTSAEIGVGFQQSEYTTSESTPVMVCVMITNGSLDRSVPFSIVGQANGSASGKIVCLSLMTSAI